MSYIVLNGKLVEKEKACLPVDDRGFLLGDGVFETMRSYGRKLFRYEDHLKRLENACHALSLNPPASHELDSMIGELFKKNELDSARVRLTVTRGRHTGGMGLYNSEESTLIITAEPLPPALLERDRPPVSLAGADVYFTNDNPIYKHKTINRLPHLSARTQAEKKGADEALILDHMGNVACTSTGNLFAVQYEQLFTAPLTGPVLPGITRKTVLELAREEGIPLREDFFSPLLPASADELFMTNSVQEIVPVVKVNDTQVGSGRPGPVTLKLMDKYRQAAESSS
ncbi:MAG: aminotransferase class IV [bacterium]